VRNRSGPSLKFFQWIGIAGAKAFRARRWRAWPAFVMIAFQADFKQIFELTILGNFARRQVAMVIENRLRFRELMVQPFGPREIEAKNRRG